MERCRVQDDSPITAALWPGWWLMRVDLPNKFKQLSVQISDLYDLFKLDALGVQLLRCFIL
jgi:hypothetical protein